MLGPMAHGPWPCCHSHAMLAAPPMPPGPHSPAPTRANAPTGSGPFGRPRNLKITKFFGHTFVPRKRAIGPENGPPAHFLGTKSCPDSGPKTAPPA